ncbi:hypothetical protein SDRG_15809 [Saprolegnia diclina VS20]|uniref:AAA+ ATPase domain-containing protein n=1 Tax=Saprolegnia diclina (strain VS20) TaxID=1156394 RepID=T0PZ04_SAPDV|nr:hypothetical protein SDRG_15809 [Saprolegnia diclina VS20]EQC26320.1 hypothetical protein SDRG_15809 [Saprolegnia diclina VS20]|eukprot:XP_008620213.1 hypothetical protein SDRG_15809 [Saprolegnia diclina VS20]
MSSTELSPSQVALAVDAYVGATLRWLALHRGGCFPPTVRGFNVHLPFPVSPETMEQCILPAMKLDKRLVQRHSYCSALCLDLPGRAIAQATIEDVLDEAIPFFTQRMLTFTAKGHTYHSPDVDGMLKPPPHLAKAPIVAKILAALKAHPLVKSAPYKPGLLAFSSKASSSATVDPNDNYATFLTHQVGLFTGRMQTSIEKNLSYHDTDVKSMLKAPAKWDHATVVEHIVARLRENPTVNSVVDAKGRVRFTRLAPPSTISLDAFVDERSAYFLGRMRSITSVGGVYSAADVKSLIMVPDHLDADAAYIRVLAALQACTEVVSTTDTTGRVTFTALGATTSPARSVASAAEDDASVSSIVELMLSDDVTRFRVQLHAALASSSGSFPVRNVRKQMEDHRYISSTNIFAIVRTIVHQLLEDPGIAITENGAKLVRVPGAVLAPLTTPSLTPLTVVTLETARRALTSPVYLGDVSKELETLRLSLAGSLKAVLATLQARDCFQMDTNGFINVNDGAWTKQVEAYIGSQPAERKQPISSLTSRTLPLSPAVPTVDARPTTPSIDDFVEMNVAFFTKRMLERTRDGGMYYVGDTQALLQAGGPHYSVNAFVRILKALRAHPDVVYQVDADGNGYFTQAVRDDVDQYVAQHASLYLGQIADYIAGGNCFFTSYLPSQLRTIVPDTALIEPVVEAVVASLQRNPRFRFATDSTGRAYFTTGQPRLGDTDVLSQQPSSDIEVEPEPSVSDASSSKAMPTTFGKLVKDLTARFTVQMMLTVESNHTRFHVSYLRGELGKTFQGVCLAQGHDVAKLTAAIVEQLKKDPRVIYDASAAVFVKNPDTTHVKGTNATGVKTTTTAPAKGQDADVKKHAAAMLKGMLKLPVTNKRFYVEFIPGIGDYKTSALARAIVAEVAKDTRYVLRTEGVPRPFFERKGETKAPSVKSTPSRAPPTPSRAPTVTSLSMDNAASNGDTSHGPTVVSTAAQLQHTVGALDVVQSPWTPRAVALDAHGVWPHVLLQLASDNTVILIDVESTGANAVHTALYPMLASTAVTKVVYGAHRLAATMAQLHADSIPSVVDLELLMEHQTTRFNVPFAKMLSLLGLPAHPYPRYLDRPDFFDQRPLRAEATQAAAATVSQLLDAYHSSEDDVSCNRDELLTASNQRLHQAIASDGQRSLCFDAQQNQRLVSTEYLQAWRPHDVVSSPPVVIHEDLDDILGLLPPDLAAPLLQPEVSAKLLDIVLDLGRRPWAWVNGARFFLDPSNHDRVVTRDDLDSIVERVGGFGSDNRAGLERQLHRISAIRNRQDRIIALTIRVGRYIEGNAGLIADLLAMEDKNILFLGEPGCGKTTIVREVSRQLATKYNVCIVDTSNEIAGDGDIPHPCVGLARRMMVPSLDDQAAVMVECVQNHTPEVMVIDEIGRPNEVEAARTCKQRGVRIVASAHGDLRKLLKNKPLRGLVGGVESVTVGDALAKEKQKKDDNGPLRKLLAQRGGEPIFEVIVELRRGQYNAWRIVTDAASAVDGILAGEAYEAQLRTRATDGIYYSEQKV